MNNVEEVPSRNLIFRLMRKKICSCCRMYIHKDQFEDNIIPSDNKDSEGNLCVQCYKEQALDNWFQIKDMINLVADDLKPLNRFKFLHKTFEEQYRICMHLMDKGVLTWKIG